LALVRFVTLLLQFAIHELSGPHRVAVHHARSPLHRTCGINCERRT
jgi:hypothetical protein